MGEKKNYMEVNKWIRSGLPPHFRQCRTRRRACWCRQPRSSRVGSPRRASAGSPGGRHPSRLPFSPPPPPQYPAPPSTVGSGGSSRRPEGGWGRTGYWMKGQGCNGGSRVFWQERRVPVWDWSTPRRPLLPSSLAPEHKVSVVAEAVGRGAADSVRKYRKCPSMGTWIRRSRPWTTRAGSKPGQPGNGGSYTKWWARFWGRGLVPPQALD